ncbi:type III PLP-dependent enzyme [Spongiactinospora rosea]|uniref:Type III PLP-dependent enzyme n=1 Tax=Spongiactinospora rosea TaxID=2248750 RepID=A0A366LXZ6_9ACTN|nr:alanine racemase [Spongiactinospora rosea]RBQ18440.1 type III PLP-dependent enzyme [Spongiactinospora rosea]
MIELPAGVRDIAERLSHDRPAYVYDLAGLAAHAAAVREAMAGVELYYAVKANPDAEILRALTPFVDGFEVSSGGELAHVRATAPGVPVAFGGPGKTVAELSEAAGVARLHVESPVELRRLIALGDGPVDILLRLNLDVPVAGAALTMGGGATPFGMDDDGLRECLQLIEGEPCVRLCGVQAHLASGLGAPELLGLARAVLGRARELGRPEINLGGGTAVSYTDPAARFDWAAYGAGLRDLRQEGETLRIEPGRAVTAYCGWYLTRVLDVKRVHGRRFAIVTGGTHHLRTPVTKGHDQPFVTLPGDRPDPEPTTIAGRLCTPKDVFARDVPAALAPGDVVAFAMAGAYAWNISHYDFLMHERPEFHYVT